MDFKISPHALVECRRRSIPSEKLIEVLQNPQQIVPGLAGRKIYQSRIDFGGGKMLLLRAIVDIDVRPMEVVTVYRTSKIAKYWKPGR